MYHIYVVMVHGLVKLLTAVRELTHEAAHNSSRTLELMKLLMTLRELAHKLHIALKKIVFIRLCLYIMQVHEQSANYSQTFINLVETIFATYHILATKLL